MSAAAVWLWLLPARLARRVSGQLAYALLDGAALVAWPAAPLLAMPAALGVGLGFGWLHPGFDELYTESLVFLLLAVAIGTLSGLLGALLTLGYALGDFLLWHRAWNAEDGVAGDLGRQWLPLLLTYALLAVLTVRTAIIAKGLAAQLALPARIDRRARFALAAAAHLLITAGLVWLWTAATPLLVRPIYTWNGRQPTIEAISPLQEEGAAVVVVALLVAGARLALQYRTAVTASLTARLDALEDTLRPARPIRPLLDRLPLLRLLIAAATSLLLLAALLEGVAEAIVLGALLLAIGAARAGLLPVPLGRWPELADRIPLVVRLAIGFLIVSWLTQAVVAPSFPATTSFRPILISTILALVVLYLLNPRTPQAAPTDRVP